MPHGAMPSKVAWVSHARVNSGSTVNGKVLCAMIETSLIALTQKEDLATAWSSLLQPDDTIGIKFNRSGAEALATSNAFGEALITCMKRADISPRRIILIEAPSGLADRLECREAETSYEREPTTFASGSDQLASVLNQITALINVPFLKTHNIAGMTCALKNLSHGLVKHPARFHGGGCSPYIGDIVNLPQIHGKLRLTLVNALRVVFRGGPEGARDAITDEYSILAATDPVACDSVGLQFLNEIRQSRGMDAIATNSAQLPYLAHAHTLGLGIAITSGIQVDRIDL